MTLVFYRAPFSSAVPVACALAELEVPHETVTFDLAEKKHKQPDFLALNPNGTVPTLVADGTPGFEALALMQWLGDHYGVKRGLWPAFDAPERLTALSWTTWSYVTFGTAVTRYGLAKGERVPELASEAHREHALAEAKRCFGVLESHLAKNPFVLGERYSLADLVVANVVHYGTVCGLPIDGFDKVGSWLARCLERPAIRREWAG